MFLIKDLVYQHVGQAQKPLNIPHWEATQGEQWLLLGKSGSGKTTLLHLLAGILSLKQGTIELLNQPIHQWSAYRRDVFRGKNIGIIFQKSHLIPTLTISENIRLPQFTVGAKIEASILKEVAETLQIEHCLPKMPSQVSQGEAQRIAVARAIVHQPALLLADEPTASLDDDNAHQVALLLQKQAKIRQTTLVIATHDNRLKSLFDQQYSL
ncbi:MAG: ATP-binding cassette domain-containing protein [Cytophagales bacterium]|nr:MAG: ATP-binding cassette domain-containing protein [Cytophagales bacterium]